MAKQQTEVEFLREIIRLLSERTRELTAVVTRLTCGDTTPGKPVLADKMPTMAPLESESVPLGPALPAVPWVSDTGATDAAE